MEQLRYMLDEIINGDLMTMTLSGARTSSGPSKVKIRPVMVKDQMKFQASEYVDTKVLHTNNDPNVMEEKILGWMEKDFKQLQAQTRKLDVTVLVSKKGKVTIKKKTKTQDMLKTRDKEGAADLKTPQKADGDRDPFSLVAAHNREKRYILKEGSPVDFLVDLGVMTKDGKVVRSRYDKFRQINRFLEFVQDILPALDKGRTVHIIDFGCGKFYLTFAMYYYLKILHGYDIEVTGLDLKKDVIDHCNALARRYGYDRLRFLHGDIASYEGCDSVDMVVTLHACDTATDYALYKAVAWNARVILSVPCCQHELNRQITCDLMAPVLQFGLLKERMAALVTDGLRGELLKCAGYKTQILEFIDMEHTPKNILIRGVKESGKRPFALSKDYLSCKQLLGVEPTLEKLLAAHFLNNREEG